MSLRGVFTKLEKLRKITGKGSVGKKQKLVAYYVKKDKKFKAVLRMALSSTTTYGIENFGKYNDYGSSASAKDIFKYLKKLSKTRGTTDSQKIHLQELASTDEETYETVRRILMSNLKIGMAAKTINEAVGYMMIYAVPYMRCHTTENHGHKLLFPCFAQVKEDGAFLNGFIDPRSKQYSFETREGNPVKQLKHILKLLAKCKKPTAHAGEIVVLDGNGIIIPREKSNGIINQCLQGCADPSDVRRIGYRTWDVVDLDSFWKGHSDVPYAKRFLDSTKVCKIGGNKQLLKTVETRVVYNWDQIENFYLDVRSRTPQGEGLVVKNIRGEFNDHTSPNQQKVVNVSRCEMRIVGWEYGTEDKKNADRLGALNLETDDGLVAVSVGQFKDDFRDQSKEELDDLVGRVTSVKFKSVIDSDSKPGLKSLYLPRFDGVRYDRNTTDTLDEILNR